MNKQEKDKMAMRFKDQENNLLKPSHLLIIFTQLYIYTKYHSHQLITYGQFDYFDDRLPSMTFFDFETWKCRHSWDLKVET